MAANLESVKKKLQSEAESAGCGKKDMTFLLNGGRKNYLLKPHTTFVRDGVVVNLRYNRKFNTVFEDEQDGAGLGTSGSISISDGVLHVSASQKSLSMFLFLHPGNSEEGIFTLLDNAKKENEIIDKSNLKMEAFEKVNTSQIEALQACYNILTFSDPDGKETRTLRSDLFIKAENNPKEVLDAFNDEKTLIKFKLFNAIKLGYVTVNQEKTELTWKASKDPFISVPIGENVYLAFAQRCLTADGAEMLEILNKRLAK